MSQSAVLTKPDSSEVARHIPELDGIRGLAAVAVVFYHIAQLSIANTKGVFHAFLNASMLGFLGVDVFFALSGFLITGILLRKRGQPHFYRNFYMRRLLRLAPPYLLTLVLVLAFVSGSGKFVLLSFVYLANFFAFFHVSMAYGPLWSLSVEEHFYFLWPWLIRWGTERGMVAVSVLLCAASPLVRVYQAMHGGFSPYFSWYRFDGLAWGALLAIVVFRSAKYPRIAAPFFSVVAGLGAGVLLFGFHLYSIDKALGSALLYSAVPMLTCGVIGYSLKRRALLAPLRARPLRFFGDISYWLYLIHFLILYKAYGYVAGRHGFPLWAMLVAITFSVSVASGVLVRKYIELPIQRLKSRYSGPRVPGPHNRNSRYRTSVEGQDRC